MRPASLALLALVAPVLTAPVPPPRSRPVYVFATMTPEQAQGLAGKVIRVKATIGYAEPDYAEAENADDHLRGIAWRLGEAVLIEGAAVVIEGRLRPSTSRATSSTASSSRASTGSG